MSSCTGGHTVIQMVFERSSLVSQSVSYPLQVSASRNLNQRSIQQRQRRGAHSVTQTLVLINRRIWHVQVAANVEGLQQTLKALKALKGIERRPCAQTSHHAARVPVPSHANILHTIHIRPPLPTPASPLASCPLVALLHVQSGVQNAVCRSI